MISRDEWTIGIEREFPAGQYVTPVAVVQGWWLWRFETINGVYYRSGKDAQGRPLVPLGVAQALYGSSPRLNITIGEKVIGYLHGRHIHTAKAQYRIKGDRFFKPEPRIFEPLPLDGKIIEVAVESMPTSRSFKSIATDRGEIDLAGLAAVVELGRRNIYR